MGYQVVTLHLKDGRVIPQVVIDSGFITKIRDLLDIDFTCDDIAEIEVTHDKWRFSDD
jgi:hypothetical protein